MQACDLSAFYSDAQRARFYAATARRRSVRTFCAPPDAAQRNALSYAAARVCVPGVRIEMTDCDDGLFRTLPLVGGIIGVERCAALIYDENVRHAPLLAGFCGEAFMLEAVSLGLGGCWVGGSFRKNRLKISLTPGERVAAVLPYGVPVEETPRERRRKKLSDICLGDPAAWPLWAFNAAECVRIAPSALNLQPWKIAYAGRTLVLQRAGLSAPRLDMGIALLHLSLGVEQKHHVITLGQGREAASLIAEDRL